MPSSSSSNHKNQKPHVPYFVGKYPDTWDTMSVPESWLTVTTSKIDLTPDELREERSDEYRSQVEDYKRESRLWNRIEQDRADAKATQVAKDAVREAERQARLNSPEHKAAQAAAAKTRAATAAAKKIAAAEREAQATAKAAAKPKTARDLRADARAQ